MTLFSLRDRYSHTTLLHHSAGCIRQQWLACRNHTCIAKRRSWFLVWRVRPQTGSQMVRPTIGVAAVITLSRCR